MGDIVVVVRCIVQKTNKEWVGNVWVADDYRREVERGDDPRGSHVVN